MFTEEAMTLFAAHHGMATGSMLAVAGLSRRARQFAVADGLLDVLYERVFHLGSAPMTLEARCAALCLAYPHGYITGPTGGRLMNLRRMPREDLVHFAVTHGAHIGPFEGVQLRQSTKIEMAHVVKRADGIRVASPSRLAFDLARDLRPLDHRSVVEQLLKERKTSVQALTRIGRLLVHPARPGSALFVATMLSRVDRGVAESHPEVVVADGLRRRGVPVELQVRHLALPNGKRIRLDMAVPSVRWAVEVDVHPDHLLVDGTTKDKQRDRWCHRIDWQVERVTELDLIDVEVLCDELADLYRARCEAVRLHA
jgi:hypothetical protein